MAGDDRGLQLVRPGPVLLGRAGQQAESPRRSPPGPTATGPGAAAARGRLAVEAGGGAGPVQPDQREQPGHFGLGRHQPVKQVGEPLGVVDEVARVRPRRGRQVALVEQQVDHGEHSRQAGAELVGVGNPVRDARVGDLPLGAGDPLRHRGLRHEERPRDLGRGQAAHDPQRQRDLRRRGSAGWQQMKISRSRSSALGLDGPLQLRQLGAVVVFAPQRVEAAAAGDREQPGVRSLRDPFDRPVLAARPAPRPARSPLRWRSHRSRAPATAASRPACSRTTRASSVVDRVGQHATQTPPGVSRRSGSPARS